MVRVGSELNYRYLIYIKGVEYWLEWGVFFLYLVFKVIVGEKNIYI